MVEVGCKTGRVVVMQRWSICWRLVACSLLIIMHTTRFFAIIVLSTVLTLLLAACGGAPPPPAALPTSPPEAPIAAPSPTPKPMQPHPTSLPEPMPLPSPSPAPATVAPLLTPETATASPLPPTPSRPSEGLFTGALIFLRDGSLWLFDANGERLLVDRAYEFAPGADGNLIAVVRETDQFDIWIVSRDGSALRRITNDRSVESSLSWAPDGSALIFAAADVGEPLPQLWPGWALWCGASQVSVIDLASGQRQALARGCDPAVSPDGRRIAYSAPPTARDVGMAGGAPVFGNTVRLINRRGEHAWNFARADSADAPMPNTGMLVYGPAWSPDGASVTYHRYLGMQVEVDINLSEIGGSFEGKGRPFAEGAGWLLPVRFAPDGRRAAIIEHNYSDARGFGGYDAWSVQVVTFDGSRTVDLPQGPMTMIGGSAVRLPRAASAAWSPDGTRLAVLLPPGWRPDVSLNEPFDPTGAERPGEVWLWQPGAAPSVRLISNVDFASPLAWLP